MSAGRVARWVWGAGPLARAARLPLVPLSLAYDAGMALREAAYRGRLLPTRRLPGPTVGVGNLSVGGAGKTPLAAWIAQYYARRGARPAILLRGYGGDEPQVLARLVPEAVVVADPDRIAAAREASGRGADLFVLDDAFQLLGVARDLNIALLSAESASGPGWRLPAGPWREPGGALRRADAVVVTRKRASAASAEDLARRLADRWPRARVAIAHLGLAGFQGLDSGAPHSGVELSGRRVLASAGVFDPESFAAQLRGLGAQVQLLAHPDHHAYRARDLERLRRAARSADYVVVTEKDAVKLRGRWRAASGGRDGGLPPEPLVAQLALQWEKGEAALTEALRALERPR